MGDYWIIAEKAKRLAKEYSELYPHLARKLEQIDITEEKAWFRESIYLSTLESEITKQTEDVVARIVLASEIKERFRDDPEMVSLASNLEREALSIFQNIKDDALKYYIIDRFGLEKHFLGSVPLILGGLSTENILYFFVYMLLATAVIVSATKAKA